MKLYIAQVDENKKLVVGKVTEVDFSEKIANVTIEGSVWNKETQTEDLESLTISFHNNDKVNMRDYVEKAKVEEGKVISAMIYEKDGKITGNSFKYNGVWEYTTPTGKQNYVFHGVVVNPTVGTTPTGKNYTKFSMAMNPVKDEETQWANITCWNNENNTLADRARKIFADHAEQKKKAIVVCGNETEYNGRKQYVGYRFDLLD